jgi:hypothetical protein
MALDAGAAWSAIELAMGRQAALVFMATSAAIR